jgi:hypothetical protein
MLAMHSSMHLQRQKLDWVQRQSRIVGDWSRIVSDWSRIVSDWSWLRRKRWRRLMWHKVWQSSMPRRSSRHSGFRVVSVRAL